MFSSASIHWYPTVINMKDLFIAFDNSQLQLKHFIPVTFRLKLMELPFTFVPKDFDLCSDSSSLRGEVILSEHCFLQVEHCLLRALRQLQVFYLQAILCCFCSCKINDKQNHFDPYFLLSTRILSESLLTWIKDI